MKKVGKQLWDRGDTIDGRYEVLQVLRGTMGIVYIVRNLTHSPDVGRPEIMAAKSMLPELTASETLVRRFLDEANLWISIEPHDNILRAYYATTFVGVPYVFADYIEGDILPNTLSGWIYRKITPPEVALFFLMQIVDGLSNAYQNNVALHGDLKPGNILIDKICTVKVADWGLSRFEEKQVAHIKIAGSNNIRNTVSLDNFLNRGTPGYAAPELVRGEPNPNKAVDIFSLGIILGEMLTGRRFPPNISFEEVDGYLTACYALNIEIRASLARVIADFLDEDPNERTKKYNNDIDLLRELFVNMTELKLRPPSIIIKPIDSSWAGQVAYSKMRLGDKAQSYELISQLNRTHAPKKRKKTEEEDMILVNWEEGEEMDFAILQSTLNDLEDRLSRNPDDIDQMLLLASTHHSVGNYDRSKELYEQVLTIDGDNEEAILGLINLLDEQGLSKECLTLGKRLVAVSPPSVSKWIRYAKICTKYEYFDEGIRACEEAIKCGGLSMEDLLVYGDLMYRSGKIDAAYEIFQKAKRIDPKNGYVWYNLGICQQDKHLIKECIQSFQKAIEFDGPKGESHNRLANLYIQNGLVKEALEHLEIASQLSPKNPKIWFNLGQCKRAVGLNEEAVRYYNIALSIDPEYKLAQECLAEILEEKDI